MEENKNVAQDNNTVVNQEAINGFALTSMIFGLIGLIAWVIPFLGYIIGILAIVFSVVSNQKSKSGMADVGIICGLVCIGISIIVFLINITSY